MKHTLMRFMPGPLTTAYGWVASAGIMLGVILLVFLPYLSRADELNPADELHPADESHPSDILLGPRSGLGTDISYRHWPDLTYYVRVLRDERTIPLWDNAVAGGRPLAGDPGVLWLYPFDLVFLALPPALAFNWLAVFHAWFGGVGNYLFLRRGLRADGLHPPGAAHPISHLAALIGGVAYLLSPKLIAHLAGGHVGLVYGAAWIPWTLLGTHWAVEGKWKGTVLAGGALTLQLLTHIQIFFYTACLAAAYAAWGLWERQKNNPPVYSRVAGIVPLFVALSAAQLFPLLGLLPYASRQAFSLEDATWYSLPPALLFTVFSPTSFQFPEWVLYPGAVSLVLAFVAFFGRARRAAYFWGGVVLFALLYAVGTATPLFPLLHLIPGFAQLRIPPRIWFIGGYALTVLAGLGAEAATEEIASRRLRRWRRHVRRLALIVYGGEAAAIMGLPLILKAFPWQLAVTLIASLITIGLLAAHARRMRCIRGRIRSRHLLIGLLVLLLAELAPTAYLYTEPVPISEILLETPALSFLRQQPGLWRVYSSHGELPYAMAATEGIEAAEGLLALQMGHYVELIKQASGCTIKGYGTGVPPCLTAEVDPAAYQQARPQAGLLGLLNVRYVLTSIPYDDPDLRLVARFGDEGDRPRSWVYENQRWLPRAFVVFHAQTLPNQAAVLDALSKVDLARTAVLAESLPDPFAEPSPPGSLPPVTAEVVARSANSLTIRTHLTHLTGRAQITRPGLLVVSQTWMPGWQAWVDGQPAHVIRVDYALQGVVLPPGEHEVVLRYQPAGWQLGWRLSVSTLAVVGVLFVYSVVRYRAPAAPP